MAALTLEINFRDLLTTADLMRIDELAAAQCMTREEFIASTLKRHLSEDSPAQPAQPAQA